MKSKTVVTVILEYQNPLMTLETLESLQKAYLPKGYKHKIIVVDNSPVPDGQLAKALKKSRQISLITTHQNTGFAAGNNLGIKKAKSLKPDYYLLLNNDVSVDKYFLKHLLQATDQGDLIVPKVYFAKGYEFHKEKYKPSQRGKVLWYAGGEIDWSNVYTKHFGMDEVDKGQYDQPREINFANFCCILIKAQVFKKVGLLNHKYFLYWEDADMAIRAQRQGFKLWYQPQAVIWHKSSGSSGSGSLLHDYYLTRNRLVFGLKYAPLRAKLALIKESMRKLFTGRPGEKKGISDFYMGKLGKGTFV